MPTVECFKGHKTPAPPTSDTCPVCGERFKNYRTARPLPTPPPGPSSSYASGPLPGSPSSASGSRPPFPAPIPHSSTPVPAPSSSYPAPSAASSSIFGPLPFNMPSRIPDLEGTVVNKPFVHENPQPRGCMHMFGCFLTPLLFILSPVLALVQLISAGSHVPSKMTIYTVRLELPGGRESDVRFEGDLLSGNFSQGDHLSLWGANRRGTLIVSRAYNHTTLSEIKMHRSHPLKNLAITAGIIVLLVLLSMLISSAH